MPEELNYHSAYKGEDVIKWVQHQLDATQKNGDPIPSWMIDAFEKAVDSATPGDNEALDKVAEKISEENSGSKEDDMFNFELVYVKAEDTTFTVVKSWLTVEGTAFADMFSLPSSVEGTTRRNALVLEQTSAASFKSFLRVLYTGPRSAPLTTYDEWVGALELALRWNFEEVRKVCIAAITALLPSLGPLARISLARQFSVGPWLRTGLIKLVEDIVTKRLSREKLFSPGQFSLDMETIANVLFACFETGASDDPGRVYCHNCQYNVSRRWGVEENCLDCTNSIPDTVEKIFGNEINSCLYSADL